MFKVLFITFSGVGLGYIFRRAAWVNHLERSISWTIWLLLFFFGLQVGANEQVVKNLDTLGLQALVIAVAGTLGSCAVAWMLGKRVFRKGIVCTAHSTCENALDEVSGKCEKEYRRNILSGSNKTVDIIERENERVITFSQFMGGFTVVVFFALGCFCGWLNLVPEALSGGNVSMYVLYLLMVQVGMSIGSDRRLKEILAGLRPKFLLLPLGTILGTLAFVSVAALFMLGCGMNILQGAEESVDMGFADCLATGAGFGYYSLSSVLITQIKEPQIGAAFAAQLGTVALMANIMREVITLLFSPLICKVFGKLAPISVGGATSMDSTLPVITAVCGKDMAFVSIFHGVLVDFSVPFLVTFFASL